MTEGPAMLVMAYTLVSGVVLSVLASLLIVGTLYGNPRLLLQDYPKDVQRMVPPKTDREKKRTAWIAVPFMLVLIGVPFVSTLLLKKNLGDVGFLAAFGHAFGVLAIFNLVDLLVLDWFLIVKIRPRFVVLPGTEGAAGYGDTAHHLKGFVSGLVMSAVAGLLIALLAAAV